MIFRTRWSQLVKFSLSAAPVFILLLVLAAPLLPQSQGDNRLFNNNGGPLSDFERQRRLDRDMEQRGSAVRGGTTRATAPSGYYRRLDEIQKSTVQLRAANDHLQQAIEPSQTPDFKRIAEYASKIRKLTSSLQSQLSLPKVKAPKNQLASEPVVVVEQLRTSVQALDQLVEMFLLNRFVRRPGIDNGSLRIEAGQEASELIVQSKRVKKLADALRVSRPASNR